jgi:hypothetical protein
MLIVPVLLAFVVAFFAALYFEPQQRAARIKSHEKR